MLLAVDIGNTNIVVGVFEETNLLAHWRFGSDIRRTADECAEGLLGLMDKIPQLKGQRFADIIMASVVPELTLIWEKLSEEYFQRNPIIVDASVVDMPILYDTPSEVGADRIVNGYAGWRLYRKDNQPLIIVDFGTATTFDVVSRKGEYLGGAIAPGIGISSEALFQKTAKLPRVALRKPAHCLGKNTVQSMQAGLVYGYLGLVKEIIRRLRSEVGGEPVIVGTGGLVSFVQETEKLFEITDPYLTVTGLRLIYEEKYSQRD